MSAFLDPHAKHFVATLLELGHHPNMRILAELIEGPRRYNELLASLPEIAEQTVGANLRQLDSDGLVHRRVDPGPPLRVLYELTELGHDLAPALALIEDWARRADEASSRAAVAATQA